MLGSSHLERLIKTSWDRDATVVLMRGLLISMEELVVGCMCRLKPDDNGWWLFWVGGGFLQKMGSLICLESDL